ncbi:MAG: tetraacyldisaccharide 4'-kinase [Terriglobales bacterium]
MATLASQIFGALVRARERAYATGRLGVARLPAPVISVGNLAVGGRGKTPTVIALAEALRARGWRVDVLSRGYRRPGRALAVAQTGDEDVALVGDEPRVMAARLRLPVLVHPDRFRAGLEGERRFASQLHLLDDGFQHRQLARAFDLVLVAPEDLEDRLLPAGRLREPAAALARAHAILWLESSGNAATLDAARRRLRRFTAAPVFAARKRPRAVLPDGRARRPLAFCALGQPESFWATLAELQLSPAAQLAFRDHHHYRARDLRRLQRAAHAAHADGFVTTAKDAVNLPAGALEPLQVVEIEMHVPELDTLAAMALGACGL